ncbi:glycoside hydrolase family 30 beta sandwich domain-containing protein [Paenibacillus sp. 19GGS1-52]|uniref:glycoside hydrolase family 30 protein n=1 Tax=Paenibacillus sp. 19GGS1-52 TaxID=2758563 RepID=UPI001EFBF6C4|nr:glycoside hydrolase family 30 beta sandwich domain-containing protein [Paenibacillus sp. 19GGS1-52]
MKSTMNSRDNTPRQVEVWLSSESMPGRNSWFQGPQELPHQLSQQAALNWSLPQVSELTTLHVTPEQTYQEILGIGSSLEETTVHNLSRMKASEQLDILKQLTNPQLGIGLNLFRITLGTSDFTAQPFYTYDDLEAGETDFQLKDFSIQKDIDLAIIATLRQLLDVAPNTIFFASPWSPPAWMKTGNSLKKGRLKEGQEYTAALAKYYRLAIQAYQEQGIPIHAMTLQNEPLLETDYPSCYMPPEVQQELAVALKKELIEHGLPTKIWMFDHNFSDVWSYITPILNAEDGYAVVDGIALHDYEGEPEVMSEIHAAYPDKPLYLTERSLWGTQGADRMARYFRNYASSYNAWVTMLDSNIGTHQWPGTPGPTMLIQDASQVDLYWKTPEFYLLGQYSRFVERGAVRIGSSYGSVDTVTNVAFRNPDGGLVMVVINQTEVEQSFRIICEGSQFTAALSAKTVGTYCWQGL